ncbi:MAG TPA: hypothetical protein VJU87_03140 [Gemmatimonadaceae bacterium]|nr:hypothetical protein [Gemmatimonadaceae bacterium]
MMALSRWALAAGGVAAGLMLAGRAGAQEHAGAPVDVKQFRYARSIPAGDSGLVVVALDAAVLAHSTRSDLRIATAGGRQVPYLVDRASEPLVLPLPVPCPIAGTSVVDDIAGTPAGARSRYQLQLPYRGLPEATLVLETAQRVFERRVSVAIPGARAETGRQRRVTGEQVIASALWRHASPDSAAARLTLALPPLPDSQLVLIVDEGDNRALPITAAALRLPAYQMRFYREAGAALTLLYGQPRLNAPRYDLALVASRLADRPLHTVALGPERAVPHVARPTPLVVFWSALVIAVTLLLALLARLLRQGGSPDGAAAAAAHTVPPPSSE